MDIIAADYLRFIAALALVLGLIAVFAWLAKRVRIGILPGMTAGSGRLKVVESLAIDARLRLVIVSRDEQEHLLLIGPEEGQLIEASIESRKDRPSERVNDLGSVK